MELVNQTSKVEQLSELAESSMSSQLVNIILIEAILSLETYVHQRSLVAIVIRASKL